MHVSMACQAHAVVRIGRLHGLAALMVDPSELTFPEYDGIGPTFGLESAVRAWLTAFAKCSALAALDQA